MMAAAPYWDIVFGNETEAVEFAKSNDFGVDTGACFPVPTARGPVDL